MGITFNVVGGHVLEVDVPLSGTDGCVLKCVYEWDRWACL